MTGWTRSKVSACVQTVTPGKSVNSVDGQIGADGVGVLKTSAVSSGVFKPHEHKRVSDLEVEQARTPVTAGTVVVCRSNTSQLVGSSAIVVTDNPRLFLSDKLWAIEPEAGVDASWLHQYLSLPRTRRLMREEASGSAAGMKNISQVSFLDLPVDLPPLPEQLRIAGVLGAWDDAIEKLTMLRTAKRLRRTWFRTHVFTGKNRLPGFSGEWRRVQLSDVLTEHKNRSSGSDEVFSVSVHKGLVNQIDHLGRSFAAKNTAHYNQVLTGDIVYTKSPTGDFPLGIVKQSTIDHPVIVSPLYGVFSPVTRDLGVILDAYFESPVTLGNYLSPLVQKGAKNTIAITNSRFLEGHLVLPLDPAEQSALARVIEAYQFELARIDAEIAALKLQKRGLMQKLLTGQWRVNVGETA